MFLGQSDQSVLGRALGGAAAWRAAVAVGVLTVTVGCKPGYLPDSPVEATPQNKELARVVDGYRQAMETRKWENVMPLVSQDYFEDNGTSDPSDDYDFNGLSQRLKDDLSKVQVLKMTTRLHQVEVDGDRAYVDIRFQTRSLVSFPAGEQWITRTDDNRLTLRREGGRWLILAGA